MNTYEQVKGSEEPGPTEESAPAGHEEPFHDEHHVHNLHEQPRITWFDASMHLIKGNLGPGCLNLPHAFGLSGWFLGSALFLLVALQGIYSMMLLAECKQLLLAANRPVYTFMDVAQLSLGPKGHAFVQIFLFVLQTGVCCVFLSLIATNLQAQIVALSLNACIGLVTSALLIIVLVRHMKDLRWLSTCANAFMFTAIIGVAVAAIVEIACEDLPLPPKSTADLGDVATFISSMFFSFEGIGLVLPVENAFTMSNLPEEVAEANLFYRTGVLPGAMSVAGILFWMIGFFASWGFPDVVNGSITAYLAERFPEQPIWLVVNTMVTLAVFFTFPLQLTPALEVLEECFESPIVDVSPELTPVIQTNGEMTVDQTHSPVERETALLPNDVEHQSPGNGIWKKYEWIIPRYSIVFGCATVVLLVDDLGLLMALFGAVGQTGLALLPCLCHLSLQRGGIAPKHRLKTLMNIMTVLFCTVVMLVGLTVSVDRIVQEKG